MYREKCAKRLKELTKNMNISLIAKNTGINQPTLLRYINNENAINIENLCKLAIYFDVTTDYLVGLENYDGTKTYINNSFNNSNNCNINIK